MAAPSSSGLYAQAIAMSGSPVAAATPESALRVTARLAERLGIDATRDAFAAVSLPRTIDETLPMEFEFVDVSQWGAEALTVSPYRAVYGTEFLPESPSDAGRSSRVPLMLGTMRNETTGFLATLGILEDLPEATGRLMLEVMGASEDITSTYENGPRELRGTRSLVEAAWTDWAFRMPALEIASGRAAPTHVYEFHWESPLFPPGLGANHALELPFMRDDFAAVHAVGPAGDALLGPEPPVGLARRMHRAFADFAISGDPGWPVYDAQGRATRVFNTTDTIENDPAAPERQAWEAQK
jgi:para-nitrobenzyl esterase